MEMVKIIAQIEGVWNLHLAAFNYSKLGTVYLAEMNQLSGDVSGEYKKGILSKSEDNNRRQDRITVTHNMI